MENYLYATTQEAQTTLRSILGQAHLDELLSERDRLGTRLQEVIDQHTDPWGVKVSQVAVKAVDLPHEMQRAMAKQAESEREKRAKIIHASADTRALAAGGQSLRGSSDFFAWVDTALSLRRHRQQLQLCAEHRAACAPEPVALTLAGTEQDMHLAIIPAEPRRDDRAPAATSDVDNAILSALDRAEQGLSRHALRLIVRVRNRSLSEALTRLTASGRILRRGDAWLRLPVPVPAHIDTRRNGNGDPGVPA